MSKTRFNKYPVIAVIGFMLWLGETWAFGWNAKPQTSGESTLDLISGLLIGWGICGDILRNVKITKNYHNITNTKKLIYQDQRVNGKTTFGTKANR